MRLFPLNNIICLIFLIFTLIFTPGCKENEVAVKAQSVRLALSDISSDKWEALARKKIFFAHQSVGNNIMDGIRDVLTEHPEIHLSISAYRTWDKADILDTMRPEDFDAPVFAHEENIGRNQFPLSKIDDFAQILDSGIGNKVDIAFIKFCFVDFEANTDYEKILNQYKEKMNELKSSYPETTFIHFTVPLLRKDTSGVMASAKKFIKSLAGKEKDTFFDNSNNVVRNKYNTMLLEIYEGKEPVFDLAGLQSTYPDGSQEMFTFKGSRYFALVPDYTDDGGHLNQYGRKMVAEQLLIFLANI